MYKFLPTQALKSMKFEDYYKKYRDPTTANSVVKTEIESVIASIFEAYPDMTFIWLQGYTPEWNDGDLCEHHMNLATSLSDPTGLLNDAIEDKQLPKGLSTDLVPVPPPAYKTPMDQRNVNDLLIRISNLYKAAYDTNWNVIHTRSTNPDRLINTVSSRYDCGY